MFAWIALAFYVYPQPIALAEPASPKEVYTVTFPTTDTFIVDGVVYKPNFPVIDPPQPPPPPPPTPPKPQPVDFVVSAQLVEVIPFDPLSVKNGDKVGDGWCVTFAKAYLDVGGTWGYGGINLSLNSPPSVASPDNKVVILFKGHVGVPIFITDDGFIVVAEANYHLNKRVTMNRLVHINDPSIRGFHKF